MTKVHTFLSTSVDPFHAKTPFLYLSEFLTIPGDKEIDNFILFYIV